MELQQRISPQHVSQQRIRHIIDSYHLAGDDGIAFEHYLDRLLSQYPHGSIELALVETLIKSWLTIPMAKGLVFLRTAHSKLKQWQAAKHQEAPSQPGIRTADSPTPSFTPSQFAQITGLDAHTVFASFAIDSQSIQATAESV